ncbi:MAG: hypothetical protein ACK595_03430, partial [Planctomycetota bacterium]
MMPANVADRGRIPSRAVCAAAGGSRHHGARPTPRADALHEQLHVGVRPYRLRVEHRLPLPCATGNMGDTACHRHDRARALVQDAQAQRPELHVPESLVAGLQPDRLASERLADEHHAAVPLDAAIGAHAALLEAVGVRMLRQAARQ